jgi:hypothetical protein
MIRDAEQRVRDFLLADADVNDAVGGRIAVGELRAGVQLPAIAIQGSDMQVEQSLSDPAVVSRVSVLIAVWGQGRPATIAVCDKVLLRITSEAAANEGIWFQSGARGPQLEEHESDIYSCTANVDVWL